MKRLLCGLGLHDWTLNPFRFGFASCRRCGLPSPVARLSERAQRRLG